MNNCKIKPCYPHPLQSRAFTLAEVLITLVIVGIVAALTIPSAINNTKKHEYVAGVKKAYSVLSQSAYKIGQRKGYAVGDFSFLQGIDFMDEFSKEVNVAKKCDTTEECFGSEFVGANVKYIYLKPNAGKPSYYADKAIITSDGIMYSLAQRGSGITAFGLAPEDTENIVGRFVVDVNGQKGPNQIGVDTFFFFILSTKGIVPAGANSASDCHKSGNGLTCAARVLKENAMNY